jgi:hypothetical protein
LALGPGKAVLILGPVKVLVVMGSSGKLSLVRRGSLDRGIRRAGADFGPKHIRLGRIEG